MITNCVNVGEQSTYMTCKDIDRNMISYKAGGIHIWFGWVGATQAL